MTSYTLDDLRGAERIDSRDLIETRDELRARPLSQFEEGDLRLMLAIDELESEGVAKWEDGAFFILETTFEDYARELAEDTGAIGSENQWPLYCIDWERAARELRMDYSSFSFLGHDYLVRS